jgi:hypothetical protein
VPPPKVPVEARKCPLCGEKLRHDEAHQCESTAAQRIAQSPPPGQTDLFGSDEEPGE